MLYGILTSEILIYFAHFILRISGNFAKKKMAAPNNFIGQLQEMAQCSRWKTPEYREVEREPQEPLGFAVECRVLDMTSRGCGKTKKLAKQESARNMLQIIRHTGVHVAIDAKTGARILPV